MPPTEPLISVVTVVLNARATVERTIKSVVGQDFRDLEYIVIDGESVDGSLEIIRKYAAEITYWTSEPDKGLYDAMNKGVRAARGRWLLFLGADDILINSLHEVAPLLTDANTIYYGDVYMKGTHRLYDGPFSAYKMMFANICHQAIFYPRRAFDSRVFDTRYRILADHAFNLHCYGDKSLRFQYVRKLISLFNDETGISRRHGDALFDQEREAIIRANFPFSLYLLYYLKIRAYRWKLALRGLLRADRGLPL